VAEYSQEDRQAICDMFGRLLEDNANESRLRELMETDSGFERELWQKMADLGLAGILIAPEYGGSSGSLEEVEALMEVAGGFLLSGPFIESCVMAPILLAACEDQTLSGSHLKDIATGSSIFAIAGCGHSGDWTQRPEVTAEPQGARLPAAEFPEYAASC
jgi:alkylation response protein AidB-like acyl-CoA dehydrogenase